LKTQRSRSSRVAIAAVSAAALSASGVAMASQEQKAAPAATFVGLSNGGVTGSNTTFVVSLKNFTIDGANVGKANAANRGHLHFALDGGKFDFPKYSGANGQLAVKLGIAGKYSPSVAPSITYKGLPAGNHTLKVYMVNNDHSNTGKTATLKFKVDPKAPAATFVSPKVSATTAGKVVVKINLKNFTIDGANVGKANAANRGHVHFALDGGKFDFPKYSGANGDLAVKLGIAGKYSPSVTPGITYSNLPKGNHTLAVFLVNNDHSNSTSAAAVNFTVG
jgi:hypothetical protein